MCFSQSREIKAVAPPPARQQCKKVTIAWSAAIGVPETNLWHSNMSGRSARGSISSPSSSCHTGCRLQEPECKTPHKMACPHLLQDASKPALSNTEARGIRESTFCPVSGSRHEPASQADCHVCQMMTTEPRDKSEISESASSPVSGSRHESAQYSLWDASQVQHICVLKRAIKSAIT